MFRSSARRSRSTTRRRQTAATRTAARSPTGCDIDRGTDSDFSDHFSGHPDEYARYRPRYPAELFRQLAALSPANRRAWDCATGNGQAAQALAGYFERVIATDASEAQIARAEPVAGVEYRVAPAEASGIDSATIDLITVAQALHWFDRERFFDEAGRVSVPGGIVAAWCYELCHVNNEIDRIVDGLYANILDGFWPAERSLIENGYRDIRMPGEEIPMPALEMRLDWGVDDMLGYLGTWSASKRYESRHRQNPVSLVRADLEEAWGDGRRSVRWPIVIRVCRL